MIFLLCRILWLILGITGSGSCVQLRLGAGNRRACKEVRLPSVLSQKFVEEFTMRGGPPGPRADVLVGRCFSRDGKAGPGVRRGRGRPPHRELCGELLTQDTSISLLKMIGRSTYGCSLPEFDFSRVYLQIARQSPNALYL